MKKFLVFMLVVSMVAFAGCAFADGDDADHGSTNPDVEPPVITTVPTQSSAVTALNNLSETAKTTLVNNVKAVYTATINLVKAVASASVTTAASATDTEKTAVSSGLSSIISGSVNIITEIIETALSVPAADEVESSFTEVVAGILAANAQTQSSTSASQPAVESATVVPDLNIFRLLGLATLTPYQVVTVKASFDIEKMKTFSPDTFYFYPQRQSLDLVGAAGDMYFIYTWSGDAAQLLTPANLASISNDASVFLAMNYNGNPATGGVGTASYDLSLDNTITSLKPLVVAVRASADSSKTVTIPSSVVPDSGNTTSPTGVGGSGGGCVAGTSALALAVLGLFIAKRRG